MTLDIRGQAQWHWGQRQTRGPIGGSMWLGPIGGSMWLGRARQARCTFRCGMPRRRAQHHRGHGQSATLQGGSAALASNTRVDVVSSTSMEKTLVAQTNKKLLWHKLKSPCVNDDHKRWLPEVLSSPEFFPFAGVDAIRRYTPPNKVRGRVVMAVATKGLTARMGWVGL